MLAVMSVGPRGVVESESKTATASPKLMKGGHTSHPAIRCRKEEGTAVAKDLSFRLLQHVGVGKYLAGTGISWYLISGCG